MRIVYMGTPEFAVPALERLASQHEVALVITRPDAVRSRGKTLEPSAVKVASLDLGLPIIEASRLDEDVSRAIAGAAPDVIVVAAYGCIIPDEVLKMARLECINIHASLLPRWRGAAPVQRALLAGDEYVGVSIMRLTHELDAGAYCRQASTEVADKGAPELLDELAQLGADQLIEALDEIEDGSAQWIEQDEAYVTRAPKIDKRELKLNPADEMQTNVSRVRASTDAAPARCELAGKGMRVVRCHAHSGDAPAQGSVWLRGDGVLLGCVDGAIALDVVKPDGKREMDASAWATGLRGDEFFWNKI